MGVLIAYLLGVLTALKQIPAANKTDPTAAQAEKEPCKCHPKMRWWKIAIDSLALLIGILTLVALCIYAYDTHRMWKEMQKQTRLQREAGINTERAWVGLDVPITLDRINTQGDRTVIIGHYSIKNFGHGPAFKVIQGGDLVDLDATEEAQKREADSYCNSAVKFTTGTVPVGGDLKQPPPFGYTLFPGEWHPETIQITANDMPKKTARFLRFIGCVAYLDQFKEMHWTRFCMERKPGDATPVGQIPQLDFCSMYNDTDEPKD